MISRKTIARHARDTRWVYNLEAGVFRANKLADRQRSFKQLDKMLHDIWAVESRPGVTRPRMVYGPGVRHGAAMVSYCLGVTYIEMAPRQRNYLTLIHEVVHALGVTRHGKKFIARYFPLLIKYAGYDRDWLTALAMTKGVTI